MSAAQARLGAIVDEMQAIQAKADAAHRDLTEAEAGAINALAEEFDAIDTGAKGDALYYAKLKSQLASAASGRR